MPQACKDRGTLAINGGVPVRETLLPYGHQSIDDDDIQAVVEALRSDWITTGPKVAKFEEVFAEYLGAKYAVSFSSGTAALHGAAYAAGLKSGDEAITTPMTFCATSNCILYQAARPVFADVFPDTLNIDPIEIENKISTKTKAIIPVDYAGHPADLDDIIDISSRKKLIVIEDACHALGATYKNQKIGSISHMTVFSFHPVKHITTGEGGMVVTNDEKFFNKLKIFRNHGIDSDARKRQETGQWYYEMVDLGFNYRLSDIASALGISQLKKINKIVERRREIASMYAERIKKFGEVIAPNERNYVKSSWHLYPIRLNLERVNATYSEIFRAMRGENIGINLHYMPVYMHPYYSKQLGYEKNLCPIAEEAFNSLISLPIFHGMKDNDVEDTILALIKVIKNYKKSNGAKK